MTLNEIQQYDSWCDSVVTMHLNIFRRVQWSSSITEIHLRAQALGATGPGSNQDSSSVFVLAVLSFRFHICKIRILILISESYCELVLTTAYSNYSRDCSYKLKPPFTYYFSLKWGKTAGGSSFYSWKEKRTFLVWAVTLSNPPGTLLSPRWPIHTNHHVELSSFHIGENCRV